MNLLQKILIPVAVLFVSFFIGLILIFKVNLEKNNNESVKDNIQLKQADIYNNIKRISEKAVLSSASYSGLKTIKRGFNVYKMTKNIDSASTIVGEKYVALSEDFENITGGRFDMAFFTSEGTALYRSWDMKKGDNIIEKRQMIYDAIIGKKTVSGLGRDSWGFAIYGVTPVFDNNSEVIGVVETRFALSELLKSTNLAENEDMVFLMSKKIVDSFIASENNYNTLQEINGLVPLVYTPKFKLEELNNISSLKTSNSVKRYYIDNYVFDSAPLKSYEGDIIGIVLFQINIEKFIESKADTRNVVLTFGILAMILATILMVVLGRSIIKKPILRIVNSLNMLSRGVTSDDVEIKTKDEVGEINKALNKLNKGYRRLAFFAKDIGEGKLETDFQTLSDEDEIGIALIDMRQKLIDAKKAEEERKLEDSKRNWATKGFAEFGEILRQNSDNIEVLATSIIRNLVKYTDSNQGGLFILNDSDEDNITLDLVAAYAYDRKKFVDKTIKLGEGLVGTCAIEKETIFITDVPDNYINITSGLGKSNPRNILIIPLKIEDKIFGVIELASFEVFEKYKIEFVEKLAESIASTLSTAKVNIITAQLLEQSQQQQEEMKAQEEELRQNMEEMLATQEETARKEAEMEGLVKAVENGVMLIEFDTEGTILSMNDNYAKFLEINKEDAVGLNLSQIDSKSDGISNEELLEKLKNKEIVKVSTVIRVSSGKTVRVKQTFSPIIDSEGNIIKIIDIAYV